MQQRTYPLSEQVDTTVRPTIFLPKLDGRGFSHLTRLAGTPRCGEHGPGAPVEFALQTRGDAEQGSACFSGPLFSGGIMAVSESFCYLTITDAKHAPVSRDHPAQSRAQRPAHASMYAIVTGDELCWYSPQGTPVFANECAQHLLNLALAYGADSITVGRGLGKLLADVLDTIRTNAHLVGPLVVRTSDLIADDEIKLSELPRRGAAKTEYFAAGFDALELDTYSSLRRGGLSLMQAKDAVRLVAA